MRFLSDQNEKVRGEKVILPYSFTSRNGLRRIIINDKKIRWGRNASLYPRVPSGRRTHLS